MLNKIYKVTEITYSESNVFYFRDKQNAQDKLTDIILDNEIQGRKLTNDNRLVNYDYASNRANFIASIDVINYNSFVDELESACMIDDDCPAESYISDL
jgi:hypothetical protein